MGTPPTHPRHMRAVRNSRSASSTRFRRVSGLGFVIAAVSIWLFGFVSRTTLPNPQPLAAETQLGDLWFHDSVLFGTERSGSIVTIHRWRSDSLRLSSRRSLDLAQAAAGARPAPIRSPVRIAPGRTLGSIIRRASPSVPPAIRTAAQTDAAARTVIPFAVSRDGRQVAWISGTRLYVASLRPVPAGGDTLAAELADTATLKSSGALPQLGFLGSGELWVYDSNGVLLLRTAQKTWFPVQAPANQVMHILGNRIALAPTANRGYPASSQVTVVESRDGVWQTRHYRIETDAKFPSMEEQQSRAAELPVAISELGHVALGTPSGEIIHAAPEDSGSTESGDSVLAAPGAVRAMGFLDDRRLLVAGDFRGLHLLSPGRVDQVIAPAEIGTSLLAIDRHQVAYAGGGNVTLGELETTRRPTTLAVALGISGVVLGIGAFVLQWRLSKVEASKWLGAQSEPAVDSAGVIHPPQPPPMAPDELVTALQRGNCILIAGTGLGAQAGLPVWPEFLDGLTRYALEHQQLGEANSAAIQDAIANQNLIAAAEELALEVPVRGFRDYVAETFGKASLSDLHKVLGKLPFAGAVTTNFDTLLDKAFAARNPVGATTVESDVNSETNVLRVVRERRFFILNMLGRVDRPPTLVFTPRPYRDVLQRDTALRQLMRSLFERYCVFFTGMGLAAIRDFLDAIEVQASQGGPKHFALVGQSTPIDAAEFRTLEKNYGIKILGFIPAPGWPEPKSFLEDVAKRVGKLEDAPKRDRPRLARLVLKNIGPFEKLDVPLQAGWNVVLGDNGVGKSIILRSIAAALSGQEAPEEAVRRLLRSGTKEGEIAVYVGDSPSPHSMQLYTDIDGLVKCKSPTFSPLRLGNWLVIGFPALRAMTYSEPKELRPPPLPSALDLTTLITNEVDARLTDLKAWLIDLRARSKATSGTEAKLAGRLFERFFTVLAAVTPEAGIKFHDIDPQKRILIEANGELVPLEAVSQGTASVLCWVGVMLQRMHEVHAALENPEHGSVMVLIDEIDAHMHPLWQQAIAPALRTEFPQLQVLATSHSPLIVGAMAPEEILVVQRVDGHPVAEHSHIDPRGMRADQLLTSGLFSLKGTRDPKTTAMLMRYTDLAARSPEELSVTDRAELESLAETLDLRLPAPDEREEARKSFELIEGALDDRLAGMSEDRKEQLRREIKVQLQGLKSGSRRLL
jgi:SIR2-like protein/putative AbiEii toxin of type IV toxin-antitoxin system/AAA domain-containing protein